MSSVLEDNTTRWPKRSAEQHMEQRTFSSDLLALLCQYERMLLRRYGVRLRVDKITRDGKNALCSIAQVRRTWFRSARSTGELIELAQNALMPLHQVGLSPLVSTLPRQPSATFPALDKNDPFGIHRALRHAGLNEAPPGSLMEAGSYPSLTP